MSRWSECAAVYVAVRVAVRAAVRVAVRAAVCVLQRVLQKAIYSHSFRMCVNTDVAIHSQHQNVLQH